MSKGFRLDAFTELLEGAQGVRHVVEIPLDGLAASPVQTRAPFDPKGNGDDSGLVESVRQDGVIQPLLVTLPAEGGQYRIIDGHRRAAAAREVGCRTVPCIVLTLDDVEAALRTGISNLQRRDLTPLEEGRQYRELMRVGGLSAGALAQRLGKPVRTVQQRVSLTELPVRVQQLLEEGRLTVHQAEGCRDAAWGPVLAELAVERGLTRERIDAAVEYLRVHPGITPQEALDALSRDTSPSPPSKATAKNRVPKMVDYSALVASLADLGVSAAQADVLSQYAEMERLSPHAVRWATLLLVGMPTMTAAAAVAYARQLDGTAIGQALQALESGLQALERRTRQSRQLTPNTGVAAKAVIGDLTFRLNGVSTELERAVGLNCAGAGGRDDA